MPEFEKIADYSEVGGDLIPSRFSEKNGYNGILDSIDSQLNDLEETGYSLFLDMWVNTATGATLDIIGEYVDLLRRGRDDETYRALIKLKIAVNVGAGQPELLISIIKVIYSATIVHYKFIFPVGVEIEHNGELGLFILDTMSLYPSDPDLVLDDGEPLYLRSADTSSEELLDAVLPAGVALTITNI